MKQFIIIFLCLVSLKIQAQQVELLKEVVPGSGFSSIEEIPAFIGDSIMIFAMDDGNVDSLGSELWRSNGTPEGTFLVKDIYPGKYDDTTPNESSPKSFTELNGIVYFSAFGESKGFELFKTDGTKEGTVLVKDIFPGAYGGANATGEICAFKDELYFSAFGSITESNSYNKELWKSDGTEAGTNLFKNINADKYSAPHDFTILGDSIYFIARDDSKEDRLWLTNGNSEGTHHVEDTMTDASIRVIAILGTCNNKVLFAGTDVLHDVELWASDGSREGTTMLKDIYPEPGYGGLDYSRKTVLYKNELYFIATDDIHGSELWKTDGTSDGTVMLTDINHTNGDFSAHSFPQLYFEYDDRLVFRAKDSTETYNLWATDGTEAGTQKVNITGFSPSIMPQIINVVNDTLYMAATINNDSIQNKSRLCYVENLDSEITFFQGRDFYYDELTVLESFVVNNTLIFRANFGLGNGYELYRIVPSENTQTYAKTFSSSNELHVYPNPSKGVFHFSSDDPIENLNVYNISGTLIFSERGSHSLDLSRYEAGVYIVKSIHATGRTNTMKILKN